MKTDYISRKVRDENYGDVLDGLSCSKRMVMDCIIEHGPITSVEISELIGMPIHLVCARLNDLMGKYKDPQTLIYKIDESKRLIAACGDATINGRKYTLWKSIIANQTKMNFQ